MTPAQQRSAIVGMTRGICYAWFVDAKDPYEALDYIENVLFMMASMGPERELDPDVLDCVAFARHCYRCWIAWNQAREEHLHRFEEYRKRVLSTRFKLLEHLVEITVKPSVFPEEPGLQESISPR